MKQLSIVEIKMAKQLEKDVRTFQSKEIWFRAWELMREKHYEE